LRGVHEGWIRVHGEAPDQLWWEVDGEALRKGAAPGTAAVKSCTVRP
jgi:hypothetical protein